MQVQNRELQNTEKTQEWLYDCTAGKTHELDDRLEEKFQEVGAFAKFTPKSL